MTSQFTLYRAAHPWKRHMHLTTSHFLISLVSLSMGKTLWNSIRAFHLLQAHLLTFTPWSTRSLLPSLISGVGGWGDRQELRVSAWAQMSANNMIAIIKWLQEALKMLTLTKYTLNWCTLKFFAIFCNHLFDFFWNINLKYEIHLAKLQNADKF